jgi:hypothetical protein
MIRPRGLPAWIPVALLGLAGWAVPSRAAVIDLFAGTPQTAEKDTPGSSVAAAPPVALSGSLFDQRFLEVSYGVQRLQVTDEGLGFEVFDPPPGYAGNARGYPLIGYQSAGGADLLADGSTAFRILFESFSSQFPYVFDFYVLSGGQRQAVPIAGVGEGLSGSTAIDISFGEFDGVDLTAVDELGIDGLRMPVGTAFSIVGIRTVPEPGPALLGGVSFATGLLLRRRRGSGKPPGFR